MLRTEHDIQAALLTLLPDPDTDADVINSVHRKIARRRTLARAAAVATSAAAAGVAAILVLAVTPSAGHPGRPSRHNVSGPAEMRTLSKIAALQPQFRKPGPGQFFYTDSGLYGGMCLNPHTDHFVYYDFGIHCSINLWVAQRQQQWIAADGSGRVKVTTISIRFVSARDRAHWIAAGRPKLRVGNSDLRYRKHQLYIGVSGLNKLPTDPAKLAKVIHDRKWEGGPPGSGEDFTQVGDLLRPPNASPKLRAAAFEVGARIPGVKSLGTVTFHGVTGAAISLTVESSTDVPFYKGAKIRRELIFDRATSTLKAEVTLDIKHGKVIAIDAVTYLASGLVNSTQSTPGHQ